MKLPLKRPALLLAALALQLLTACSDKADQAAPPAAPRPALTVLTVQPQIQHMARRLEANGNVAAWQEASLGAESGGLRLAEVRVNVGARVKRGELLAEFATDMPSAELAQARAHLAEAAAAREEARANASRARTAEAALALSPQQIQQYLTAATAAEARHAAAEAAVGSAALRLQHTRLRASDDGLISFRAPAATVGAVVPQGQELFRLIRGGRLEWRAEVPAAELGQLKPGQAVRVHAPDGSHVAGTLRVIAPTVEVATRKALVYVDLPAAAASALKAGMFARGEFALPPSRAPSLPRQALALRDGFDYVFVVAADGHVRQTRVEVGQRDAERVEILAGLPPDTRVVASGAGFLNDGDLVQVVSPPASPH